MPSTTYTTVATAHKFERDSFERSIDVQDSRLYASKTLEFRQDPPNRALATFEDMSELVSSEFICQSVDLSILLHRRCIDLKGGRRIHECLSQPFAEVYEAHIMYDVNIVPPHLGSITEG